MKIDEDEKKIRYIRKEALLTLSKKWEMDYKNCTKMFLSRMIESGGRIWWKITFGGKKESKK